MACPQNDAVLSREKVNTTLTSLLAQSSTLLLQYDAVWEEMELERKKLEWKNKFLKKRAREVEERERSVEERRKEVDVTYELVRKERERCRWKVKRVRRRERKVKEMERVWRDEKRESGVEGGKGYADIRIKVRMNGRDLLNFLNGRVNDHEVLREEVVRGLALSKDPGKLVLDAVEGFYREEGEGEGGGGFEIEVVRKSCVLLLEELMRMGVEIGGKVRERAARMALEWKGKMRVGGGGGKRWWFEVVGFLQLVATYGLVDGFEKEEVLMLFESCACYERSPQLCVNLGFGDCVCDIIRSLVQKHQPFDAIRLLYAFELVDIFPPVPILKAHLERTFDVAEEIYINGDLSTRAQIKCLSTKLKVLASAIGCIKEYDLVYKYPVQPLEKLTSELKRQKRKCTSAESAPPSTPQPKMDDEGVSITVNPIASLGMETTSSNPVDSDLAPAPISSQTCPDFTLGLDSSLDCTTETECTASDSALIPAINDAMTVANSPDGKNICQANSPRPKRPRLTPPVRNLTLAQRRLASALMTRPLSSGVINPNWPSYIYTPFYYSTYSSALRKNVGYYMLQPLRRS